MIRGLQSIHKWYRSQYLTSNSLYDRSVAALIDDHSPKPISSVISSRKTISQNPCHCFLPYDFWEFSLPFDTWVFQHPLNWVKEKINKNQLLLLRLPFSIIFRHFTPFISSINIKWLSNESYGAPNFRFFYDSWTIE